MMLPTKMNNFKLAWAGIEWDFTILPGSEIGCYTYILVPGVARYRLSDSILVCTIANETLETHFICQILQKCVY